MTKISNVKIYADQRTPIYFYDQCFDGTKEVLKENLDTESYIIHINSNIVSISNCTILDGKYSDMWNRWYNWYEYFQTLKNQFFNVFIFWR
jgi:hypothetical protein